MNPRIQKFTASRSSSLDAMQDNSEDLQISADPSGSASQDQQDTSVPKAPLLASRTAKTSSTFTPFRPHPDNSQTSPTEPSVVSRDQPEPPHPAPRFIRGVAIQKIRAAISDGRELRLDTVFSHRKIMAFTTRDWTALQALLAASGNAIDCVHLPTGMPGLPAGLSELPALTTVHLPRFDGMEIDTRPFTAGARKPLTLVMPGARELRILQMHKGANITVTNHDRKITAHAWDQDGKVSTGPLPSHAYFREPREFIKALVLPEDATNRKKNALRNNERTRVRNIDLNGAGVFPAEAGAMAGRIVVCRHFAIREAYDQSRHDAHRRVGTASKRRSRYPYRDKITPQSIAHTIPAETQAIYTWITSHAPDNHLVSVSRWGEGLQQQFEKMSASGQAKKIWLVFTHRHGMMLRLTIKPIDATTGEQEYSAILYDPNASGTHKRMAEHDFNRIRDWTFGSLLKEKAWQHNYLDSGSEFFHLAAWPEEFAEHATLQALAANLPAQGSISRTLTVLASGKETNSMDYLGHLMNGNFPEHVAAIVKDILASTSLRRKQKVELLAARNADGIPGFLRALQDGHHQAVSVFVKAVLATQALSPEQKVELLAARDSKGVPGFLATLQNGHHQAVDAFVKAILTSRALSAEQKVVLLAARDANGTPSFMWTLHNGHHQAVSVFVRNILASEALSTKQKIELLAAWDSNGTPGFVWPLRNGHHETVTAFATAVLASKALSSAQKINLLAARDSNGTPAFCTALQNGQHETVAAFLEAILSSKALSPEQKFELLAARDSNGTPSFMWPLLNGDHKTVTAVLKSILSSEALSPQQKVELLAARDANGIAGFLIALQNGHHETVAEFIKAVLASNAFDLQQKSELIAARSPINGATGLLIALQMNRSDVVVAFAKAILASDLPDTEKLEMLELESGSCVRKLIESSVPPHPSAIAAFREVVGVSNFAVPSPCILL